MQAKPHGRPGDSTIHRSRRTPSQDAFAFDPLRRPLYRQQEAKPNRIAGVPETLLIAILAAGLFGTAFVVFGSRLLFDWYLHEVRGMSVVEEPGEAIVTYPLA
jgi:hypothetical protein